MSALSRRRLLLGALALAAGRPAPARSQPATLPAITVYKDPT